MDERYVFGYFRTPEAARKAAEELKTRGFEAYVDRFSPMGGGGDHDFDDDFQNPFTNQRMSLAESTLGSPKQNKDIDILAAAHPDASGFSGGNGFETPEDVCVTVFTPLGRLDEARKVLEQHGARK
jgi:hypothetical protein